MHCRKAELLIQLESDDEALALLEGNPSLLARGLKAKIYAAQNRLEEVIALCDVAYQGIDPIELEGMVHLLEMFSWSFYVRQDYAASLRKCEQAGEIAKNLGLLGRLKTLATHQEMLHTKLGSPPIETFEPTGNTVANQYRLTTHWRSLMVTGEFDKAANLSLEPALSKLALATKYFYEGSIYRAASSILDRVPSSLEFKLYHALLTLQIYVKSQDALYTDPSKALKILKDLEIIPQMLEEARCIYPLGICLAAAQIPTFEGASKMVPKLKHSKYRDSVWIDNKLVAVLPNEIRTALIYDSLNLGEHSLESVRRQYRHRATISLSKAKLEYRQIITQAEINRDVSRLSKFLVR